MFIRKNKIKQHIQKVKEQEARKQSKIWQKKIDERNEEHKKNIIRLNNYHYKKIKEKNREVLNAKEAWIKYKEKALELATLTTQLRDLCHLYKMNAANLYKYSSQISDGMEKAERFILNYEPKINQLLNIEE